MRERTISRNIITTTCEAKVINLDTCEVSDSSITISGKHTCESALKVLKSKDSYPFQTIKVLSVETIEQLRIMTEDDFIKYSTAADKRYMTKKGKEQEQQEQEQEQQEQEQEQQEHEQETKQTKKRGRK